MDATKSRTETKFEIQSFLDSALFALDHDATIKFEENREADRKKPLRFRNNFTISDLFPNDSPVIAIKRELKALTVEEYMKTVKDLRYPEKGEMREFGKVYAGKGDVYIKFRVELLSGYGGHSVFVMSFHYAEIPFTDEMFPFKK